MLMLKLIGRILDIVCLAVAVFLSAIFYINQDYNNAFYCLGLAILFKD